MNMLEDAGQALRSFFCTQKDNEDDSEFVEVDPTRQYGRYKEILGRGAFKTVYKGFDQVNGIEVAWNQIKVHDVAHSPEDFQRLYSEVHLLKTLKHKNIMKLYSSWVDIKTENVNFITEIFTSGNLRQYRKKHKHVDMRAVKSWARQILRGLLYLHSHDPPIIHRDLKCDNIFVNGNQGEVKIGDLGMAVILKQANAAHSVIGTPEFMAPELYEEEYDELVDVYSFGMCVLEMVTTEYPYSECKNAAQIYKRVSSGKKPAALDRVKDAEMRAFIKKCLAPASHRLPARELLMDPFLQCDLDSKSAVVSLPFCRLHFLGDDVEELGILLEERLRSMSTIEGTDLNNILPLATEIRDNEGLSKSMILDPRSMPFLEDPVVIEKLLQRGELVTFSKSSSFSDLREQIPATGEITIKGTRRDDDTIYLRLRISSHEGGCFHNIHFPFDVEADTALCVASEMVAELDLSDHDVNTIAEMIDAEIVALVPDWRPGAAFDESVALDAENAQDQAAGSMAIKFEYDVMEAMASDGSLLETLPSNHTPYLHSLKFTSLEVASPLGESTTMHGRFEEISYVFGALDHSFSSYPYRSSDSCEVLHNTRDGMKFEDLPNSPTVPNSEEQESEILILPESGTTSFKDPVYKSVVESEHNTASLQDNSYPELYSSQSLAYATTGNFSDFSLKGSEDSEWLCVVGSLQTEDFASNSYVGIEAMSATQEVSETVRNIVDAKTKNIIEMVSDLAQGKPTDSINQGNTPDSQLEELGPNTAIIYTLSSMWVHPDIDSGTAVSHIASRSSLSGHLDHSIKTELSDTSLTKSPVIGSSDFSDSSHLSFSPSEKEQSDSILHFKRDSFTQYYKTGRTDRSRLPDDSKSGEPSQNQTSGCEIFSPRSDLVEQQKREQLKKSIADLEAKTLQGLHSSKKAYLPSNGKKPGS